MKLESGKLILEVHEERINVRVVMHLRALIVNNLIYVAGWLSPSERWNPRMIGMDID